MNLGGTTLRAAKEARIAAMADSQEHETARPMICGGGVPGITGTGSQAAEVGVRGVALLHQHKDGGAVERPEGASQQECEQGGGVVAVVLALALKAGVVGGHVGLD